MSTLSPRWRKVLRDAFLHKARTALVVAALVTGLVGSGALLDAWSLVRRVTAETYVASHPVSATLRVNNLDHAAIEQVRGMPAIAAVRGRRAVSASMSSGSGEIAAQLFAFDEYGARDIAAIEGVAGTWPPRDGEIVIEKSSLEFSGTSSGDSVSLRYSGGAPVSLPVTGVAHDVGLAPGWMEHVVYGFVTPATLAKLGASPQFDELQFVVRDTSLDREGIRRIANEVKQALERDGHKVLGVNVPVPMQHVHAAQMDSMMFTQGAFALLTLLACAALVVNLISAMLASELREIGVMKAIGARPAQLAAMYLVSVAAMGILSTALALPLAMAIGRRYGALKADLLNFPVDGFAIPWWAIAIQLAAGILVPMAAAAFGIARACRMPVNEALRDPGVATTANDYRVRQRLRIRFFSRPLTLSIGNAFRRRKRMLLTLVALTLGGAVFVAADSLRQSVRDSVGVLVASQRYDLIVRTVEPQPASRLEGAIAKVTGVDAVEAAIGVSATPLADDGTYGSPFPVFGLVADTKRVVPNMLAGQWLDTIEGNSLVVNRSLANDDPRLFLGANLTLLLGGRPSTWTVAGIVDVVAQPMAYARRDALGAARGDERATVAAVVLSPAEREKPLPTILRMRSDLEEAGIRVAATILSSENRRAMEDHLLLVVDFLGVMGWVMIAVGGMGLASTMGMSVLERTREIGVMRAIGARTPAIIGIVQAEGLVIALLGWASALVLSVPMSLALGRAFGAIMFPVPDRYVPTATGTLAWLGVAAVVSIVACAWPALRATRIPTAAALTYA
ncbi:MAG TPA: FtsX-like permease family protein [Usitatibacter sp.]